jgi:hypothetical protein
MGMLRDLRDLKKASKQYKRPSLRDGLKQANEAMQHVQADQQLAQDLVSSGVDAQATIKALRATGAEVNNQPQMEMDLTLDVNGTTSEVTHAQVVSMAMIGQLQPGATVPAKVDPNDHSRLMLGLG